MKSNNIYWKHYIKHFVFLIFVLELGFIIYINMHQLKYHSGYDSSSYFLKAYEIFKQNTWFCQDWINQTNLYLDSPVPLAAFLYSFTNNIFLAYGVANIIITLILIWLFYKITNYLCLQGLSKWISVVLFLCPYLTGTINNVNDLGYFSLLFTAGGFYSVKLLIALLIILIVLKFYKEESWKTNIFYILASIPLLFISGISSGYHLLLFIIAPMVIFAGSFLLSEKKINRNVINIGIYSLMSVCVLHLGKSFAINFLKFESRESGIALIDLKNLWNNAGAIILGNLHIINALPEDSSVQALSSKGIAFGFTLIVAALLLIATINIFKINRKEKYPIIYWCGVNLCGLLLLQAQYGSPVYEIRYLIPNIIAEIFFLAMYIEFSLTGRKRNVIVLMLVICIGFSSIYSVINYSNNKNNYDHLEKLTNRIGEEESHLVYVYGDGLDIVDKRNLRVIDLTKTYKILDSINMHHGWGDYSYYNENSTYKGNTLLVTTSEDFNNLPNYFKNKFHLLDAVENYEIYKSEINIIDLESGFTEYDYNIDFPYSPGINMLNGCLDDEGMFVSDGSVGWIALGPYSKAQKGDFKFVLNYEIESAKQNYLGAFDIAINNGNKILESEDLLRDERRVVIENVEFNGDEIVEYRVNVTEGTIVKIKSVEIFKIN